MNKTIVTLFSGGLDSTVLVYWLNNQQYIVKPLYVDYGSKHKTKELDAAQITCKKLGLELKIVKFDLTQFGESALTDRSIDIPSDMNQAINTVVPFRNMLLTTLGATYAEAIKSHLIALSPTKEDYEVYKDCRKDFFTQMELTLKMGSKYTNSYEVLTPFIHKLKEDVIKIGERLKVPFEDTWTCYKGGAKPCGVCPACQVRIKGFKNANLEDPLLVKPAIIKKKIVVEDTSTVESEILDSDIN